MDKYFQWFEASTNIRYTGQLTVNELTLNLMHRALASLMPKRRTGISEIFRKKLTEKIVKISEYVLNNNGQDFIYSRKERRIAWACCRRRGFDICLLTHQETGSKWPVSPWFYSVFVFSGQLENVWVIGNLTAVFSTIQQFIDWAGGGREGRRTIDLLHGALLFVFRRGCFLQFLVLLLLLLLLIGILIFCVPCL